MGSMPTAQYGLSNGQAYIRCTRCTLPVPPPGLVELLEGTLPALDDSHSAAVRQLLNAKARAEAAGEGAKLEDLMALLTAATQVGAGVTKMGGRGGRYQGSWTSGSGHGAGNREASLPRASEESLQGVQNGRHKQGCVDGMGKSCRDVGAVLSCVRRCVLDLPVGSGAAHSAGRRRGAARTYTRRRSHSRTSRLHPVSHAGPQLLRGFPGRGAAQRRDGRGAVHAAALAPGGHPAGGVLVRGAQQDHRPAGGAGGAVGEGAVQGPCSRRGNGRQAELLVAHGNEHHGAHVIIPATTHTPHDCFGKVASVLAPCLAPSWTAYVPCHTPRVQGARGKLLVPSLPALLVLEVGAPSTVAR